MWGAHSVLSEDVGSYDDMVERAMALASSENVAVRGDHIVIVAGIPFGRAGTTNNLRTVVV
jgi:pyruvate kinase